MVAQPQKSIIMTVYCSHHNLTGVCTEEDFNDAKEGRSPSRMVRVQFPTFTQAVPFNTLSKPKTLKDKVKDTGDEPLNWSEPFPLHFD